jgi:hypothetical protein
MAMFRVYLVVVLACVTGYAVVVANQHGWNYFTPYFSSIAELTWSGQFNLDFLSYLGLSGLWVAWRHRFSGKGITLGVVVFLGGTMFFAPYLLWASAQAAGDAKVLLLGKERSEEMA